MTISKDRIDGIVERLKVLREECEIDCLDLDLSADDDPALAFAQAELWARRALLRWGRLKGER